MIGGRGDVMMIEILGNGVLERVRQGKRGEGPTVPSVRLIATNLTQQALGKWKEQQLQRPLEPAQL